MLRENSRKNIEEKIRNGELALEKGRIKRVLFQGHQILVGGSHHKILLRLVELVSSVIEVLEYIQNDYIEDSKKRQACGLIKYFHTFDCVFYMQFMLLILGLTENLSIAKKRSRHF